MVLLQLQKPVAWLLALFMAVVYSKFSNIFPSDQLSSTNGIHTPFSIQLPQTLRSESLLVTQQTV